LDTTILKGVLTGLILSLPFGPVGVYCMELTIVEGRWKGYITALWIWFIQQLLYCFSQVLKNML